MHPTSEITTTETLQESAETAEPWGTEESDVETP
jgi:hypothetical protein